MTSSASKSKAPSTLKQSLVTSGFILLWGIFHALTEKSSSPAHTGGDKPQSVDDNLKTKKQDSNSEWFQKIWRKPVRWKVVFYDTLVALLPVVITALGISMTVLSEYEPLMPWGNIIRFIVVYLVYGILVVVVFQIRRAALFYSGETEKQEKLIILFLIVALALLAGVLQHTLGARPLTNLAINLVLSAAVALLSQASLSLPSKYEQDAN